MLVRHLTKSHWAQRGRLRLESAGKVSAQALLQRHLWLGGPSAAPCNHPAAHAQSPRYSVDSENFNKNLIRSARLLRSSPRRAVNHSGGGRSVSGGYKAEDKGLRSLCGCRTNDKWQRRAAASAVEPRAHDGHRKAPFVLQRIHSLTKPQYVFKPKSTKPCSQCS